MNVSKILDRLRHSSLFKDSFWAVFGNGAGYGLLLLAGILIARFLGKDLYGEYGMVKTTMFYIASFSTFGLGYISTKFVAQYKVENPARLRNICSSTFDITLCTSSTLAVLLIIFAPKISEFLNEPQLSEPFRLLGIIIIIKALSTAQIGILAGLGKFKQLAINNVIAGAIMLLICVPLTYYFGLRGSLFSLAISQFINVITNAIVLQRNHKTFPPSDGVPYIKELLRFSFPVALQEFSFTVSSWGGSLILVKYASLGDLGICSAAAQWNAIVTFIPAILSNVVLSHLSATLSLSSVHKQTINRMLLVNLLCTLPIFIVVILFSRIIQEFYGDSFVGLSLVLQISVFSTIFSCCSNVFQSEMISQAKTWSLFCFRFIRDAFGLIGIYVALSISQGKDGAFYNACIAVLSSILYFTLLGIYYNLKLKNIGNK